MGSNDQIEANRRSENFPHRGRPDLTEALRLCSELHQFNLAAAASTAAFASFAQFAAAFERNMPAEGARQDAKPPSREAEM